jgi:hypothetical protein
MTAGKRQAAAHIGIYSVGFVPAVVQLVSGHGPSGTSVGGSLGCAADRRDSDAVGAIGGLRGWTRSSASTAARTSRLRRDPLFVSSARAGRERCGDVVYGTGRELGADAFGRRREPIDLAAARRAQRHALVATAGRSRGQ